MRPKVITSGRHIIILYELKDVFIRFVVPHVHLRCITGNAGIPNYNDYMTIQ